MNFECMISFVLYCEGERFENNIKRFKIVPIVVQRYHDMAFFYIYRSLGEETSNVCFSLAVEIK
jgi:hypothetical protein